MTRAVIPTGSVERGMVGACRTSTTMGGILLVAEPFERPGVGPPATQFWPYWFGRPALRNCSDAPNPSCSANHSQPRRPESGGPSWRIAQSPASAYPTLSTRSPAALFRLTLFRLLLSTGVELVKGRPLTSVTVTVSQL